MNNLELLALMHVRTLRRRWDQPRPGDWAGVLAKLPLFSGVNKRRLRKLAGNATFAEFAPGETIVFAGDPDDRLYIILTGHAKTNGRVLRVGEYFGEVTAIDGSPGSAGVFAMSYVHVMRLPSRSVLKLARRHPAITLTMLRDLTARLRRLEAEGPHAAAAG